MFIKYAAFHLQQLGAKKQKEREARSQDKELESKLPVSISPLGSATWFWWIRLLLYGSN